MDSTSFPMNTESVKRKAKKRNVKWKQNIPLLIMFFPVIIYFLLFKYAPMFGVVIAFKQYNFFDGILGSPWVGMNNFELMFNNPQMVNVIRNTLFLSVLSIVVGFPFPIVLAILLNEVRYLVFKKSVQTLVYLPHFFNWVIVGGMIITLFSQESGFVNHLLRKVTGESFAFLYNEWSWIAIFTSSGIWKEAGFSAIIYLAAMTSIDPSLYESASIDGANKWRKIWHITIPGISSTIILLLVLSMGRIMEVGFDHVYVLQNQVVSNVSEVISTFIYKFGLKGAQFSLTAALGLFESVVGLILVVSANAIARKYEQGLW